MDPNDQETEDRHLKDGGILSKRVLDKKYADYWEAQYPYMGHELREVGNNMRILHARNPARTTVELEGINTKLINAIKNKVGSKERATFEYQRESRKLLSETISGAARSITRLMETTDSTHAMTLLGLPVGIPLIRSLYTILILVALAAANKYFPKLMVLIPLKKVDRLWDSVNPLCDPYGGSHHWCTADYFVSG